MLSQPIPTALRASLKRMLAAVCTDLAASRRAIELRQMPGAKSQNARDVRPVSASAAVLVVASSSYAQEIPTRRAPPCRPEHPLKVYQLRHLLMLDLSTDTTIRRVGIAPFAADGELLAVSSPDRATPSLSAA